MEKHITVVAILNIVYRSLLAAIGIVLFALGMTFGHLIQSLMFRGPFPVDEFPFDIINIAPIVLLVAALLIFTVSGVAIIGAVGVLRRKNWGRIILLIVSFLNLLHIPLGTALGAYSIWVLMNDETIRLFGTPASHPAVAMS